MRLMKVSTLTGKSNTMVIPKTMEEVVEGLKSGKLIQDAFPDLTPDQREFLLTGITPEEWDELFGEAK